MSTEAHILGIGEYSERVKNHLDYSWHYYHGVKKGTKVLVHLFHVPTRHMTEELASLVGISNCSDFGQHEIDINNVNLEELEEVNPIDAICFRELANNDFTFMFVIDM